MTALVAETLRLPVEQVAPLAETLLRKTNGNPFFLQQFLTALVEQQLLRFDAAAQQWTWDEARIEVVVAADNVVDLLIARLRRLSEDARRVLTLGACMGQEFDLATLSLIWQRSLADLTGGLWEALREGLVIPLDASYRYLAESVKTGDLGEALHSRYRFLHDRVQQGAYELVGADERAELHLRIGRLLLGDTEGEPSDDKLFEVVRQMNLGEALIVTAEDRRRLARFNLRAAIRVAGLRGPRSALPLLRRCLDLLGPDPWEVEHGTAHRAHLALAECEFMSGNVAGALQALDALEARSRTVLERVAGREIRIVILASATTGMLDAVACGVETARLLGAEFPTDDAALGPAIGAELGALKAMLADRTVESLLDLPSMADPEKRALVDVLFKTNAPAFMAKPEVSVLIGLKAVRLAIEHGNAPMSPYFYDNYGIINNATGGELDVSFRFGQLGIDLLQRPGYAEIESLDPLPVRGLQLPLAPADRGEPRAPAALGQSGARKRRLPARRLGGAHRHVLPALPRGEHPGDPGRRPTIDGAAPAIGEPGRPNAAQGAGTEPQGPQRIDGQPHQSRRRRVRRGWLPRSGQEDPRASGSTTT